MEDVLTQITKEATGPKNATIRNVVQEALTLLQDASLIIEVKPHELREKCLQAVQLTLESKNSKLSMLALACVQTLLNEPRFNPSLQLEAVDRWLPMQVMNTVSMTPSLSEEVQVEVMRILLNIVISKQWGLNADVVTKLAVVVMEFYDASQHNSVKTAAKATLTQTLTAMVDQLHDKPRPKEHQDDNSITVQFTEKAPDPGETETLSQNVVQVLQHLCDKLDASQKSHHSRLSERLMLEGIYVILAKVPRWIRNNHQFVDVIWQHLCPSLIVILGNPLTDKSVTSHKYLGYASSTKQEEVGRGSGCSFTAPTIENAKIVYGIAIQLVRLVGCFPSLWPVLESVFHRMMLYPPAEHRLEVLKAVSELMTTPEHLLELTDLKNLESTHVTTAKKNQHRKLSLLKIIMDSIQECCHCHESSVCIIAVGMVNDFLISVEQLANGQGISLDQVQFLQQRENVNGDSTWNDKLTYFHAVYKQLKLTLSPARKCEGTTNAQKMNGEETRHDQSWSMEGSEKHFNDEDYAAESRSPQKFQKVERRSAQEYIQHLKSFIPSTLESTTSGDIDNELQQFSSDVCSTLIGKHANEQEGTMLNADGVYLTTYYALLLNLKLMHCGYYKSEEKSLPISEHQFVESILSTDVLVYLSRTWLSEVFHQVIMHNLLEEAGYTSRYLQNNRSALIQLLVDIDGLDSREIGGQFVCGCDDNDTDIVQKIQEEDPFTIQLGKIFAREVLEVSWEAILDVLSVLLNGKSACGITGGLNLMFNAKEETRKTRDAICNSLQGLQRAAQLSCVLGTQERCSGVFAQLANASCVLEQYEGERQPQYDKMSSVFGLKPRGPVRLHAAHALSMDVLLSIGLEMGSHASDCWPHVLRCCSHICQLEHTFFTHGNNQTGLKVHQDQHQFESSSDDASLSSIRNQQMQASMNDPNYNLDGMASVVPTLKMQDIIKDSNIDTSWDSSISGGGVLQAAEASKALWALSQKVDRLYDAAANKLNMKSLGNFLKELCKSSSHQLASYDKTRRIHAAGGDSNDDTSGNLPSNVIYLFCLGEIVLKCLRQERPLLHVIHFWSIVEPHFVEAACHWDQCISKKAVQCIHEIITTLFTMHPEMPYFNYNESFCKPLENILCLDLCDGDVQDQIVCSICELVEACTDEIKSGWRPLFGALRAVKIQYTTNEEVNEARQRHVAAVLDVFDVFLNTNNVLVFANAAVDCILCLLKYVRGPAEFEDCHDDDSDTGSEYSTGISENSLVLPALKYLKQCCVILASGWSMPACPIFNGAQRIKADSVRSVDPVIPGVNLEAFHKLFNDNSNSVKDMSSSCQSPSSSETNTDETSSDYANISSGYQQSETNHLGNSADVKHAQPFDDSSLKNNSSHMLFQRMEHLSKDVKVIPTYTATALDTLDNHTGVLRVWYLVLEGLASTVSACPKNFDPQTLDLLFELLRSAVQIPGPTFVLHCANHMLLPILQSWLRRGSQLSGYWDSATTSNFKQCSGFCTDLVVELVVQYANDESHQPEVEFLVKQLLDVLTEYIAQPTDSLSRLGCACIRHALLSCGPLMTERMWQIASVCLHQAFEASLSPLLRLMTPFCANSENFYGDIGVVKVAVRKDCSAIECERLRSLAQQVFLLDNQRGTSVVIDYEREAEQSYIFLIYPQGQKQSDEQPCRVSFQSIVVGLISHQILLQTVGCLLIQGSPNMLSSERGMIASPGEFSAYSATFDQLEGAQGDLLHSVVQQLPGMMKYMSCRNMWVFLKCLKDSYKIATQFDSRPGLKFLIQKVIRADVAANMYKQAGVSWTFHVHSLMELCLRQDDICVQKTKELLAGQSSPNKAMDKHTVRYASSNESSTDSEYGSDAEDTNQSHVDEDLYHVQICIEGMQSCTGFFLRRMKVLLDEACEEYVDLYLDKEEANAADRLSGQMLLFLLIPHEEVPTLKRTQSLRETVAEKLLMRKKNNKPDTKDDMTETVAGGVIPLQPVSIQADPGKEPTALPNSEEKSAENHKEKHHSGENRDKIYTVATDKTIKSLMTLYKRRKQVNSMPNSAKSAHSKPVPDLQEKAAQKTCDPALQEIEQQQKSSIMKDTEAHLNSKTEMICNVLELFHQLPDVEYRALLPAYFSCIHQLICHSKDVHLREVLAHWTYRVGHLYGFAMSQDKMF